MRVMLCVSFLSKEDVNHQEVTTILKNIKMTKVVIGQLNVNYMSEKFHSLRGKTPKRAIFFRKCSLAIFLHTIW